MAVVASEPAEHTGSRFSGRGWKIVGSIVVAVLALFAAGAIGWVVRGDDNGSAPTVSVGEAGRRYLALAQVVNPRCQGIPSSTSGQYAGQCKPVLISMAAMLRGSSWPEGATRKAAALAAAIDKHVAFLDRIDAAATPAEKLQIAQEATKQYPNNPYSVTNRAADALREALGLPRITVAYGLL